MFHLVTMNVLYQILWLLNTNFKETIYRSTIPSKRSLLWRNFYEESLSSLWIKCRESVWQRDFSKPKYCNHVLENRVYIIRKFNLQCKSFLSLRPFISFRDILWNKQSKSKKFSGLFIQLGSATFGVCKKQFGEQHKQVILGVLNKK